MAAKTNCDLQEWIVELEGKLERKQMAFTYIEQLNTDLYREIKALKVKIEGLNEQITFLDSMLSRDIAFVKHKQECKDNGNKNKL